MLSRKQYGYSPLVKLIDEGADLDSRLNVLTNNVGRGISSEKHISKPAGINNIPAEIVKAGGEAMIEVLTSIWNKI